MSKRRGIRSEMRLCEVLIEQLRQRINTTKGKRKRKIVV